MQRGHCRELHDEDGVTGAILAELIALHADFGCQPVHAFRADRDRSRMVTRLRAIRRPIVLDDDDAAVWSIDQIACGAGWPIAYLAAQNPGASGAGPDAMTLPRPDSACA